MNESRHTYEWVMPHIWMSHVTYMNESCRACKSVMSHKKISSLCVYVLRSVVSSLQNSTTLRNTYTHNGSPQPHMSHSCVATHDITHMNESVTSRWMRCATHLNRQRQLCRQALPRLTYCSPSAAPLRGEVCARIQIITITRYIKYFHTLFIRWREVYARIQVATITTYIKVINILFTVGSARTVRSLCAHTNNYYHYVYQVFQHTVAVLEYLSSSLWAKVYAHMLMITYLLLMRRGSPSRFNFWN